MTSSDDRDTALKESEAKLIQQGILKSGDRYVITCGEPMGSPGGTNMLKICRVA
jgi:pyruvate kinase